jgi:hypothetical protein
VALLRKANHALALADLTAEYFVGALTWDALFFPPPKRLERLQLCRILARVAVHWTSVRVSRIPPLRHTLKHTYLEHVLGMS